MRQRLWSFHKELRPHRPALEKLPVVAPRRVVPRRVARFEHPLAVEPGTDFQGASYHFCLSPEPHFPLDCQSLLTDFGRTADSAAPDR